MSVGAKNITMRYIEKLGLEQLLKVNRQSWPN